ncbi:hypothetical protein [Haloarchaeobius iranensis]|uniref:Uncharacterized protein n=1 Tax=Haloarchaeobius iranensis TaxID=996166 RepID=A0A1G9YM18_9EURY|nr:hypothetical protein [Haloarchaeobius iranensis]SDN09555.1 hypothetical protein SAMN05192554_1158 [Haloarchaeobius iranensis]
MAHRPALLVVLLFHLLVAGSHGAIHGLVPVPLPDWASVLVLTTTFFGPLADVVLDGRDHQLGRVLFTASMAGAFALGVLLHFVVESPDYVHAVPSTGWAVPFQVTAVAVAVTSAAGTVVGLRLGQVR